MRYGVISRRVYMDILTLTDISKHGYISGKVLGLDVDGDDTTTDNNTSRDTITTGDFVDGRDMIRYWRFDSDHESEDAVEAEVFAAQQSTRYLDAEGGLTEAGELHARLSDAEVRMADVIAQRNDALA